MLLIICVFCLITSAGVRMRQETISAVQDAMPCIIGVGRVCLMGRWRDERVICVWYAFLWFGYVECVDELWRALLTAS